MTIRPFIFRCLAIGVGLLVASRSIDADEPAKEKKSEPSKPSRILIDKLEKFRAQREDEHRDWIFAYDEAIALIDEDITEFKSFEVRKSGGLRVFKAQDEKDKVIQTLEKVRDAWKERFKTHEAQLVTSATRHGWLQMPDPFVGLNDFNSFDDLVESKIGRFSIDLNCLGESFRNVPREIPAGSVPITDIQWPGWIPARSVATEPKKSVPIDKTKKTVKATPLQPALAPKALDGPFDQGINTQVGAENAEMARTAFGAQPESDDISTYKRNLYQRLNFEMQQPIPSVPETPDETLRNLDRFVSGRAAIGEDLPSTIKNFGAWRSDVQSVIDVRNVVVSLWQDVAPQIAHQEEIIKNIRKIVLDALTSTRIRETTRKQVLSVGESKIQDAEREIKRLSELRQRRTQIWIRGVATKGMFDGKEVQITDLLVMSGTESYITATGAKATIPLAETIDVNEVKKFLMPRPTLDEYHDSPAFRTMAKRLAEKAAERLRRQQADDDAKLAKDEKKRADGEKMAEMRLALAKTHLEDMKHKLAMLVLEQLIKQYPDTTARLEAEDLLKQLQAAGDAKKNNTAEKRVERIDAAEARLATAKQFIEKKNHKGARLLLERLVKEYPETVSSDEAKKLLKTLPE